MTDMGLRFDNSFCRDVPRDESLVNVPRQVLGACYSSVSPTAVAAPKLLAHSREVAALIGLDPVAVETQAFAEAFGGNALLPGMESYAACYGGHQFGNWAGQLGDGRAMSLGEVLNARGERFELQLKGAGPTPYSRQGDGRAVLRSSVREFLCSEAMFHLGVPTTRALSLVGTGDEVVRDMLYDGNPKPEPGAIVCRVAPSFLRFGSFELLAAREHHDALRALAAHAMARHAPELGPPTPESIPAWLEKVCSLTARMIMGWMRVGFVHGVMNTDNMSVAGLTIDYGPYGWVDNYDLGWTPNTTDRHGRRYRFGHQPSVGLWNLIRFANALYPLTGDPKPLEKALDLYTWTIDRERERLFAGKLGLLEYRGADPKAGAEPSEDDALVDDLDECLQLVETDMTIFYRALSGMSAGEPSAGTDAELLGCVEQAFYEPDKLSEEHRARFAYWLRRWRDRVRRDGRPDHERQASMRAVNPKYVLRNYMAQLAIDDAEQGDPALIYELLELLRRPYDEQPDKQRFAAKRPDWARSRPGCSQLSCSS